MVFFPEMLIVLLLLRRFIAIAINISMELIRRGAYGSEREERIHTPDGLPSSSFNRKSRIDALCPDVLFCVYKNPFLYR